MATGCSQSSQTVFHFLPPNSSHQISISKSSLWGVPVKYIVPDTPFLSPSHKTKSLLPSTEGRGVAPSPKKLAILRRCIKPESFAYLNPMGAPICNCWHPHRVFPVGSKQIGPRIVGPQKVVPQTVGLRGPTVRLEKVDRGLNCCRPNLLRTGHLLSYKPHYLRAIST